MADLTARIETDFAYHPPSTPEVAAKHEQVRDILRVAALALVDLMPACREQSLMLTSLEEAMFWGNGAIARHQYLVPVGAALHGLAHLPQPGTA